MFMRVEQLGEGKPEFAVVGLVHGDEPCGKKAIEKFLNEEHDLKKPVKFIIANEKALEEDKRFIEADLNRSFPGDRESDMYEERLAAELLEELEDLTVLDIHSTRSYPKPFATMKSFRETDRELVESTGVNKAVLFEDGSGTLTEFVNGIIVESGFQKSDQAIENAYSIIKNFLAAHGVIDDDYVLSEPEYYRYEETVEGDYEFLAENFERVREGEVYATNGEKKLEAERDFYPVLMSTEGYKGMLGFKAEKISQIDS